MCKFPEWSMSGIHDIRHPADDRLSDSRGALRVSSFKKTHESCRGQNTGKPAPFDFPYKAITIRPTRLDFGHNENFRFSNPDAFPACPSPGVRQTDRLHPVCICNIKGGRPTTNALLPVSLNISPQPRYGISHRSDWIICDGTLADRPRTAFAYYIAFRLRSVSLDVFSLA